MSTDFVDTLFQAIANRAELPEFDGARAVSRRPVENRVVREIGARPLFGCVAFASISKIDLGYQSALAVLRTKRRLGSEAPS